MALTDWPTAADVSGFLNDAGYGSLPSLDIGALVSRAVDELHSSVGFSPFLADPCGEFPQAAVSGVVILDRLFATVTAVSLGGAPLSFRDCPQGVTPIRRLALDGEVTGEIKVTGRPGFGATIPFDIWYAVRDLAAGYVVETADAIQGDGVESIKQDSVTVKYRTSGIKGFAQILSDRAYLVFSRYRLAGIGG